MESHLALYCAVPYMAACVVVSGTVFWDRLLVQSNVV